MQHLSSPRPLTPHQYTLLMEQAKHDAVVLRREAIAAFWAAVGGRLRAALSALTRRGSPEQATACPR
jgi:hypothetical protein